MNLQKTKGVRTYQRKHCKSCKLFGRGCFGDAYCDKHTKPWSKACEEYR